MAKKKFSATSDNFFRGNNGNNEVNNENHIKNYYNSQKTSENYKNNQTNPNQSPKIQSGKLRENQQNLGKKVKKFIIIYFNFKQKRFFNWRF